MTYNDLIQIYLENKYIDKKKALDAIEQMKQMESKDKTIFGRHYFYLSQFYFECGNLEESMNYALKGVHTLRNIPYTSELSKCYNIMGVIYNSKRDSLHALDWYLDAMDIIIKNNDTLTLSNIYNNIGCIYDDLQDYESAIEYFKKALELIEDKDNEAYSLEVINLALMYCEIGDWDKVEYYYNCLKDVKKEYVLYANEIHLAVIKILIAYHHEKIDAVRYQLKLIQSRIEKEELSTNNFDEIVNLLPKIIDTRIVNEISDLLKSLNKTANVRQLLDSQISLVDANIRLNELIGNEDEIIQLSKKFYRLSNLKNKERSKMAIDGINLKLQMREMVLEHQRMEEQSMKYRQQAQRDELTGLYNRSIFKDRIETLFRNAISLHKNIGVVIVDINDFKQFNDCYGHVKGDKCIRDISGIMLRMMDENLYFLRYGGDEFLGFFYDVDELTIKSMIHLIESEVRALNIEHKTSSYPLKICDVTQGAYIAIPRSTDTLYDFIAKADDQLYKGKRDRSSIVIKVD